MSRKIWIVAQREYLAVVKRWGFIVTVVMIPLAIALPSVIIGFISAHQSAKDEQKTVVLGVVDQARVTGDDPTQDLPQKGQSGPPGEVPVLYGSLRLQLELARWVNRQGISFRFYEPDAFETAQMDMKVGRVRGFYVIPEEYLKTGKVIYYGRADNVFRDRLRSGDSLLGTVLVDSLLHNKVSPMIVQRVKSPLMVEELTVGESGQIAKNNLFVTVGRNLLPLGFGMLLMVSLFMASGYLLHGVAVEKGNRIMELLLSSVTPVELMGGKLIGLGAAGLTQVTIWLLFALGPVLFVLPALEFRPLQFVLSLLYFLLGYLLFGSLILGLGSLGETQHEAQQLAGIITFTAALPLVFSGLILTNPDSTLSRLLGFIPFTAPSVMIIRIGLRSAGWIDTVGSLAVLALSVYLCVSLAAKLFRIGVLLYGKRPTIPEIWRWVWA
ncbi:MAG: ABC transporter permease [Acidobacteria bacterium]|nr:ABC transporter permease [Acidobacteriota bacterium]